MHARRANRQRRFTGADQLALTLGVITLLAGVALLLVAGGAVMEIIGIGLIGLAGVAFVGLIFLLVGESEDRDREGGAL